MVRRSVLWFFAGAVLLLQSCAVNNNIMFKSPKNEAVNANSIPLEPMEDYHLSVDDKIIFRLTTNNGSAIIERMTGISEEQIRQLGMQLGADQNEYVIRQNGEVKLPVIGHVKVEGLTIAECEDTLERKFSVEYQQPFIQVQVTNQRVIVFSGNGSDAKVIPLMNTNTTLMEAITQAGGITERGKANTVKLMRKVNGKREVYTMDLSTIEGLKYVDMIVQGNDYIYVEPTPELVREILNEVGPVVSLLSTAKLIFTLVNTFK